MREQTKPDWENYIEFLKKHKGKGEEVLINEEFIKAMFRKIKNA